MSNKQLILNTDPNLSDVAKYSHLNWLRYLFRSSALVLVLALVSVLISNNRQSLKQPDTVVVHANVQTMRLPPPPPPPKTVQQVQSTPKLDVRIAGDGPTLTLSKINMQASKPVFAAKQQAISTPSFDEQSIEFDTSSFGLSDLDSLPRLLTPLNIKFTPDMRRLGIKKVTVKLHVQIDTHGQVYLKSIKHNDYPQLNNALKKLVRTAKFTPPKREGKLVKAEFIWPLNLKE
jgi:outer membrane biosynthesis protein TonB